MTRRTSSTPRRWKSTLGNTDEQTHDFDGGKHTREANISGMLFVDEGTKNDLHDEGEYPLAAAGVKVTLVGPTLLMRDSRPRRTRPARLRSASSARARTS